MMAIQIKLNITLYQNAGPKSFFNIERLGREKRYLRGCQGISGVFVRCEIRRAYTNSQSDSLLR